MRLSCLALWLAIFGCADHPTAPDRSYSVARGACGSTVQDPDDLAARVLDRPNVSRVLGVKCVAGGSSASTIRGSIFFAQRGDTWIVDAEGRFSSPRSRTMGVGPDGTLGFTQPSRAPCGSYYYLDRTGEPLGSGYGGCGRTDE